ncbi:MAG: DUF2459 domain-containing protein [Bacteroidetes bacterium HGW-Bacteroidetes-11]|nr:MAG: DUF2459 domain-containing protein [Bacteroidetes bacterium HGW-Bacteroidetes-11]
MKSGNLTYRLFMILIFSFSFKLTTGFGVAFKQSDSKSEKINAGESIEFFVLQAGWHTGIVLRTKDVSPEDWPEVVNYLRYTFVDIGWGDEHFYQDEEDSPALAVRAALFPTSSVIHIVPFNVHPLKLYGGETFLKRIEATPTEFSSLCRIISSGFERDEKGNLIESNIYKASTNYFKAKGKYHIFNTCNTWVVRCLKEAGYNVNPNGVITQHQLIKALEKLPGKAWESNNEW